MTEKTKKQLTEKEIEEIFGEWDNPSWQEVAAAEAEQQRKEKAAEAEQQRKEKAK